MFISIYTASSQPKTYTSRHEAPMRRDLALSLSHFLRPKRDGVVHGEATRPRAGLCFVLVHLLVPQPDRGPRRPVRLPPKHQAPLRRSGPRVPGHRNGGLGLRRRWPGGRGGRARHRVLAAHGIRPLRRDARAEDGEGEVPGGLRDGPPAGLLRALQAEGEGVRDRRAPGDQR